MVDEFPPDPDRWAADPPKPPLVTITCRTSRAHQFRAHHVVEPAAVDPDLVCSRCLAKLTRYIDWWRTMLDNLRRPTP
jgi:hypothetical protein